MDKLDKTYLENAALLILASIDLKQRENKYLPSIKIMSLERFFYEMGVWVNFFVCIFLQLVSETEKSL